MTTEKPSRIERSATAEAASNIAFVKYWGAQDLERAIPVNPSISMTLDVCRSICSVTFRPGPADDEVWLADDDGTNLRPAPPSFASRVLAHTERLRRHFGAHGGFRVATRNTFPAAAGLASSASGFAALSIATTRALGLDLTGRELSDLARESGSGSASRSVYGGYVEWPGADGDTAARQIAGPEHWALCDIIAVVETRAKEVSSLDGHRRAASSPYYPRRQELLPDRLARVRRAIECRDIGLLGDTIEEEAIDLHLIAMSSRPAIFYWQPATVAVLHAVRRLRAEGVPAYSTMDAGANVHVICEPASEPAVSTALAAVPGVERVIRDRVGSGPVWRNGAEL
jgi:diphosphomevalonate decarboxylase